MSKTAELIKETITVSKSTQWGPVANNELYGLNEPLTSVDFVPGNTYEVLVKKGNPTAKYPNGKKYISQIVGIQSQSVIYTQPNFNKVLEDLQKSPTIVNNTPKQRDFDAEARGKTRCALFAAALSSPSLAGLTMQMTDLNDILKLVEQAADRGVKYSFQDK